MVFSRQWHFPEPLGGLLRYWSSSDALEVHMNYSKRASYARRSNVTHGNHHIGLQLLSKTIVCLQAENWKGEKTRQSQWSMLVTNLLMLDKNMP